jgi:hypothetical protein
MDRLRYVLGFVVAAFLIASSFLHSILGWPSLSGQLRAAGTPEELIGHLTVGWHLGGAAMFTFGCILIFVFGGFLRDRASSLRVGQLIGIFYVGFGVWGLVESRDAFFAVMFVLPGLLLLVASTRWPTTAQA